MRTLSVDVDRIWNRWPALFVLCISCISLAVVHLAAALVSDLRKQPVQGPDRDITAMAAAYRVNRKTLNTNTDKYSIVDSDEIVVTFRQFFNGLQTSRQLRETFVTALRDSRFQSYFWETPCYTSLSMDRAFEFVLVNAPRFVGMAADPSSFAEYIGDAEQAPDIRSFRSLGGDAVLVVPVELTAQDAYSHISPFIRQAPSEQVHNLWKQVGKAAISNASERATWVSTAGGGVPWLHVRLDSTPKYYTHERYRRSSC